MARDDQPVVKTVLKTRHEKTALDYLRRIRAHGALANLVVIVGFYTRTGRRYRRYEVRQLIRETKGA